MYYIYIYIYIYMGHVYIVCMYIQVKVFASDVGATLGFVALGAVVLNCLRRARAIECCGVSWPPKLHCANKLLQDDRHRLRFGTRVPRSGRIPNPSGTAGPAPIPSAPRRLCEGSLERSASATLLKRGHGASLSQAQGKTRKPS